MKCQTAKALHPSPSELAAFAVGSLDDERAAIIESHVYACDRCADAVAQVPDDDFLKQLQSSHFPEGTAPGSRALAGLFETVGVAIDRAGDTDLAIEVRDHPRYSAKRLIAEGAMGRVYLAQVRGKTDFVAIKVMRPEIANQPGRIERFLQESRIAEKLNHPNVARVIGCEASGRLALIAMEFVEGRTLAQIVRQRGPLPIDEARECLRQMAEGLAYAAKQGVVHRDIKPHNVMFEPRSGFFKIVDFGLGRLVDEQRTGSRLTREHEILGTLNYIAPEQLMNSREANEASDIYSLGCTFYYLLTGGPPFTSKSVVELLKTHESERPIPVPTLRPEVPTDMAHLVEQMMQKDPPLRPQSMQEILDVLAQSQSEVEVATQASAAKLSKPARTEYGRLAVLHRLASPVVLLPLATCLGCLLWLVMRR
ncbi:MAG TPA: protein kinase [Lacipirellulaceae bacterium]|nr:protein kinase [Lacipirellulaceae bacterium]